MNTNEKRILLRKAQISQNISSSISGAVETPIENISISDFKERLEKGERFWKPASVVKFREDLKKAISSAYRPEDKEELLKKGESDLANLTQVTVVFENGSTERFYSEKAPTQEISE